MKVRKRRKGAPARAVPTEAEMASLSEEEGEDEELQREAVDARRKRVSACREDVNEFCIFASADLTDGETEWTQEELHETFQLLADLFPYLIVMSHPESGKTTQLTVMRTVFELGNDPNLRFVFLSHKADSKGTAAKIALLVRQLIEKSPRVAEVFPELVPGSKWEETIFTVRRSAFSKDPSVQVVGYKGTITGSRVDRVICDDLLVLANTQSPEEREKFAKWFTTILDRMTEGARCIFLCNAWHPRDFAHEQLRKQQQDEADRRWYVARIPVHDEHGNFSCSMWNDERWEEERTKYTPIEIARIFFCRARDDGESPFDAEAIKRAFEILGRDYTLVPKLDAGEIAEAGAYVVTGVDLAVTQGKKAHRSSFTTGILWPEDSTRQLLWAVSARLRAEQIAEHIVELDERYGCVFVVENNAAQRWIFNIVQLYQERRYWQQKAMGLQAAPVRLPTLVPFTTGRNKAHPEFGLEGLAAEVSHDSWIIPTEGGPPDVIASLKRLREAMEFYTRGAHTPDELISLWLCREGLRRGLKAGKPEREGDDHSLGQVRIIGAAPEKESIGDRLLMV